MMFVDVTVLLPVYLKDDAWNFRTALKSLLFQTYVPKQIIVLVDGTVPNSIDLVLEEFKSCENITIKRNATNIGLANILNMGLKHADYELIARMDSDDICAPERIEKQYKFLKMNPKIGICGTQTREFSQVPGDLSIGRTVPTNHAFIVKFMKYRCPFNHPTVMFRKSVVEKVGGYPVKFPEDYWLWWYLYRDGVIFSNLSDELLDMRLGERFMKRRGFNFLPGELGISLDMCRQGLVNVLELPLILVLRIIVRASPLFLREWFFNTARSKLGTTKRSDIVGKT